MARIFTVGNNDSSGREMKVFSESNNQAFKIRKNVDKGGKFMVAPVARHPVAIKVLSKDSRSKTDPGFFKTDTFSIDMDKCEAGKLEIAGTNQYLKIYLLT